VTIVSVFVPLMVTAELVEVKARLATAKLLSSVVVRFWPLPAVKFTLLMLPGSELTVSVPAALVDQFPLLDQAVPDDDQPTSHRACRGAAARTCRLMLSAELCGADAWRLYAGRVAHARHSA